VREDEDEDALRGSLTAARNIEDSKARRRQEHGDRIRELKNNLSRYIRQVEAGQRIAVTAHGRVVAELVPPGTATRKLPGSRWDELIAAGILHPPVESGDPFEDWPDIRLPPGTAAELIDADRGEA
jgi:antitoxin (DNA-binding transcriptional repressor) of toxin-antitoxin stability system